MTNRRAVDSCPSGKDRNGTFGDCFSFPSGRRSNDTKKLRSLKWCGIFAGMTFKENGMTFRRGKRNGD
jgi:hypothetical protein